VLPYRRFAVTLAGSNARLGADADRYSFIVVDLHLLLFAGFDRRTINLELRNKRPRDETHGGSKERQKPVLRLARLSGLTGAVE
jgi:hypothetical protein